MTAEYTPTQLLFDKIFSILQGLGIEVIDVKDIANDIPYPFFVIKKFKITKSAYTFNSFHGVVRGTIDIWSEGNNLGRHDQCIKYVENTLSKSIEIEDYQVRYNEMTINTIDDYSTDKALLHSIINVEYEIL
ncbi:hypothetical protein M3E02_02105 [Staphylococcus epidermidis]|uniref:hypothetical protein n=1 Tax=Staphylococcus epidermidis TaxID=1282 RepID=UPI0021A42E09|nr:hypothetical protein [Staphylococcus epidermidis]MCT2092744.1 hypothetical protein [Staphylococcus epidermidis]